MAIDASQYCSTSSSRLGNIRVAKLLLDPNGRTPAIRHVARIRSDKKLKILKSFHAPVLFLNFNISR